MAIYKVKLENPVAKKRGRPLGSKNKKKPAAKPKSFKRSVVKKAGEQMQVAQLQKRVQELELIRERLHNLIDRQEHKAIQYQAVIDYLETKLELN